MSEPIDLLIVGAGPAGLAAAIEARALGASVTLLDENPAAGGQVWRGIEANGARGKKLDADYAAGAELAAAFRQSGAEARFGATVWSLEPEADEAPASVFFSQNGHAARLRARRVLLATGATERPVPIPGWTLPGVMTVGAAQILLKTAGLAPQGRVWLAGQGPLLRLYAEQPDFVQPSNRLNEMRAFVERGLKDLSISRTSFDWGVPVPGSPNHVMYVWLDALANYLTPSRWPAEGWEAMWPADLHVIGKDVVRFHAIYWPAFLMSAGLPLPGRVFGHGFVLNRGAKMSKSLGNIVEPGALAETFGVDPLRYYLLRAIQFGQDGEWSHEAIGRRINADLANDLGNLAQRTLSMIAKACEGRVPPDGPATDADRALLAGVSTMLDEARAAHADVRPDLALDAIWVRVSAVNAYLNEMAPWALRKTDPARADIVLYHAAECVRQIALLVQPAMPSSAARLLDQLSVDPADRGFAAFGKRLVPGTVLPAPQGVFPRWVEPADETDA